MKKCPFCAEEIQDEAVKCKHCGENFDKKKKGKWYFSMATFIMALLCVGPFALPLFWFNPRFTVARKILVSVIVLIISYFLGIMVAKSLAFLKSYYQMAQ